MLRIQLLLFVLLFCRAFPAANAQNYSIVDHSAFFTELPKSDLLLLGTFHFKDAGLDGYKPKYDIDILSPKRQKEVLKVIAILKKFGPTKIAIEAPLGQQARVDSLYQAYLADEFDLKANEIYQIGFRLAKLLGHERVYAVDAKERQYYEDWSAVKEEYNAQYNAYLELSPPQQLQRAEQADRQFTALYAAEDAAKINHSLLEVLLSMNEPDRISAGHGHYLTGNFKMGSGDDYFGPDNSIGWYSRNLRIFHNLTRLHQPGDERVLLLIGAGHLPFIRFLAEASPDFELRELREFVKR